MTPLAILTLLPAPIVAFLPRAWQRAPYRAPDRRLHGHEDLTCDAKPDGVCLDMGRSGAQKWAHQ